ncbi:OLC1v1006626C1 [Oldenlandia corymbosa var. corymbosa]|uniref:OLC1v1006626C1 n=1 Tax=Oldenlandia corymbosa var. corymbosa TaxID=529605 RepID=A0AAV1DJN9_OLDCO|nr:OLC1v1006626C1 [Oldenlandia corymbosa var. corymbosa]
MATQTLILQNPAFCISQPRATALRRIPKPTSAVSFKPSLLSSRSISKPSLSRSLCRRNHLSLTPVRASSPIIAADVNSPTPSLLTGSTRTVTTLLAIAIAASKVFANRLVSFALPLKGAVINSAGPAFFAAIDQTSGSLNTPFTVVAAGMAKWLDIYSGVLMVRVLLSWFPNIPWDRQPFSAVRDLCDPYLNLFRNIIPPIFDTLDVSPLLAFAVLGTLGSILKSSKGGF